MEIKSRFGAWIKKPTNQAGILAALGCVLYFLGRSTGGERPDPNSPWYLMAERELPQGHPLSVKDMERRQLKSGEGAPLGVFTDQKLHWVLGRRLLRDLKAGEWVFSSDLEKMKGNTLSQQVPAGFRAYSLEVDSRLPIAAGDKIDLIYRSDISTELPVTLLEAVQILMADLEQERLVVAIRPSDLPLLEKARQTGKLSIALRNDMEGPTRGKRASLSRKRAKRIEVWTEGE